MSSVVVRRVGAVAIVSLDRPQVKNALDRETRAELLDALRQADADDELRCIVLTGAGDAFCAGVDLKELRQGSDDPVPPDPAAYIARLETPVVGAINGACVTGGLELALACDFLFASETAFFLDTHASLGFVATWGLYGRLADAVGVRHAKEICLSGRRIWAEEALRIGLVNRVTTRASLLDEAVEAAAAIARVAPHVRREVIRQIEAGSG
jgi:enoyl-CoA hydratase